MARRWERRTNWKIQPLSNDAARPARPRGTDHGGWAGGLTLMLPPLPPRPGSPTVKGVAGGWRILVGKRAKKRGFENRRDGAEAWEGIYLEPAWWLAAAVIEGVPWLCTWVASFYVSSPFLAAQSQKQPC